jgi:hypothetical protein
MLPGDSGDYYSNDRADKSNGENGMRGGYRHGAGRPRGSKSKPAEGGFPANVIAAARKAKITPLEYALAVMNDEQADPVRRDRMAAVLMPFIHARVADNRVGKKDTQDAEAKTAGAGTSWGDDLKFEAGQRWRRQ